MSIFNNADFYPTPESVSEIICSKVKIFNKVILEPSMGKGDLVDVIRKQFPKQIIGCEKSQDLLKISSHKVDRVLGSDFLEINREDVSHINCIIANPPFSCADKHILHMWKIAPDGCEIVTLCNWETIDNDYSNRRSELNQIIKNYGYSENLGEVFSDAERKTNVKIGLIFLTKPIVSEENYDMYFDMYDEEEKEGQAGLMQYNEVRNIVQRYVGALKMFESVKTAQNTLNSLIEPIRTSEHGIYFQAVDKNRNDVTFDTFKSELQKSAWITVFRKLGAEKYMTASLKSFLNKFVEQQKNVPFTMSNIYKMIEMVIGTHGDRMSKVIVEVFDRITERHSENRYSHEGWKTNSEYIVNKKFILPAWGLTDTNFSGKCRACYSHSDYFMDDLTKALCHITGTKYESSSNGVSERISTFEKKYDLGGKQYDSFVKVARVGYSDTHIDYLIEKGLIYLEKNYYKLTKLGETEFKLIYGNIISWWDICQDWEFGTWYNFNFVRVKVYRKKTIHVEFLDNSVWEMFNREAAKNKGFQLASKYTSDFRKKETGVEIYKD